MRDIIEIMDSAKAISLQPCPERQVPAFPCAVVNTLADVDLRRVTLVMTNENPVFVYPVGTRP